MKKLLAFMITKLAKYFKPQNYSLKKMCFFYTFSGTPIPNNLRDDAMVKETQLLKYNMKNFKFSFSAFNTE